MILKIYILVGWSWNKYQHPTKFWFSKKGARFQLILIHAFKASKSLPLAFKAGTVKHLSLSDSKLTKHRIAIIWFSWGLYRWQIHCRCKIICVQRQTLFQVKLASHSPQVEETYILRKLTLNSQKKCPHTSSDQDFHWMVVGSVQMTVRPQMLNYLYPARATLPSQACQSLS